MDKYIGIPFRRLNCWQFVQYFYRCKLGIKLPDFSISPSDCKAICEQVKLATSSTDFTIIEKPELYDLVFIKLNSEYINHIGIWLGNGKILHSYSKTGSCIVNGQPWTNNIAFFARFNQ